MTDKFSLKSVYPSEHVDTSHMKHRIRGSGRIFSLGGGGGGLSTYFKAQLWACDFDLRGHNEISPTNASTKLTISTQYHKFQHFECYSIKMTLFHCETLEKEALRVRVSHKAGAFATRPGSAPPPPRPEWGVLPGAKYLTFL